MNLNNTQINNLIAFLNRVNLQGNEAETLVQLKIELMKELERLAQPPVQTKVEKPKEEKTVDK